MADALAFTQVCDAVELATSLTRIEARGTVRLALKVAGLDARSVSADQMRVVVERVLPDELESRGIDNFKSTCESVSQSLGNIDGGSSTETPESVFRRLGGS